MTVYLDPLHDFSKVIKKSVRNIYGSQWCNMASDTEDLADLHALADKIGLRREWFRHDNPLPCYYLTPDMRLRALENGAIEITSTQMIQRCSKLLKVKG